MDLLNSRTVKRWEIRPRWRMPWQRLTPPQLFVGSFALLIILGMLGLKYLPGLYTPQRLEPLHGGMPWLDALFTATSAVCITGLAIADTGKDFTFWGQAYLLLLIQLGGLGVIAFSSVIIVALGRRLSLHYETLSGVYLVGGPHIDQRRMLMDVIRFTFAIEGLGAFLLYLIWIPKLGFVGAIWPAIFHSISAFCNAGFSTFSDSLMSMRDQPLCLLVMMALIVVGGLGFLTMEEISLWFRTRRQKSRHRISLHSRTVLVTTLALIVAGWFTFLALEWDVTLKELGIGNRIVNALFMSISSRTAGFNNIDYAEARESTCFLTMLLMVVGGSPGSTAGGIKTTTFALLGIVAWSRLRGQRSPTLLNRSIREETVNRTIGLVVVAFAVMALGVLFMTFSELAPDEKDQFLHRVFETASAFNTVGLSMGMTGELTWLGRWTAIILMFVGRVGTLTFAAALAVRYARASKFRYAYEDMIVG